jgi:ubiquinone/menaquinone biosynthesis C-methylase UbiE
MHLVAYNWVLMTESDIQVLASLRRAEMLGESSDRKTLESHADRFWIYKEDWSDAYGRLSEQGLIEGDDSGYLLTESGRPAAEAYHAERPDHYWYYYQYLYPASNASKTHSLLCERAFGKDLCQDGQVDMACLDDIIGYLDLKAGDSALDLGCGAGGISEYISDSTGALVTGLDYTASGIATAIARTESKRDRLAYVVGDMNALTLPAKSFNAVISLDTVYWVEDLDKALLSFVDLIKPGGILAIIVACTPAIEDTPAAFEPDGTWVARALKQSGLSYEVYDYTASFLEFWPKLKQVALELRDDFIAEGNELIYDSFMHDADEDYLPAAQAGKLRRYLYIAKIDS